MAHLEWVIGSTQQWRDALEQLGSKAEAERATELADELSAGCRSVALKVEIGKDRMKAVEKAAMTAASDQHLNRIGVVPGALNYLPTKNALYWLGRKMSSR